MAIAERAQWISGPTFHYGKDDAGYYKSSRNHILSATFGVADTSTSLTLSIAVLGLAHVAINGKPLDAELLGEWTNYRTHVLWRTFDLASLTQPGRNTIAIELGNGWYNPSPLRLFGKYNLRERLSEVGTPQVLASISAGDETILVTDDSWTCTEGPLLFNNVYLGETHDLRDVPAAPLPVLARPNTRLLQEAPTPPCRRLGNIELRRLSERTDGLFLDFGATLTGFIDLRFVAREGDVVRVRYAEDLDETGAPDFRPNAAGGVGLSPEGVARIDGGPGAPRLAAQADAVICREGENRLVNRFTYHSFRYALVEGLSREVLLSAWGIPVHTDLAGAGSLSAHHEGYDELMRLALATKLNNVHGIWEDCARERLGYGGDMVALCESNLFCFDCQGLIEKTLADLQADQTSAGGIPETAPFVGIGTNGTAPGEGPLLWQLAYPYLLLSAVRWYGDVALARTHWPHVRRMADYLLSWDPADLTPHCLGDHGSLATKGGFRNGTPDKELVGWCAILWIVTCAQRLAHTLAETDEATRYAGVCERLRAQIRARFLHADGTLGDDTQTACAFGAYFGLGDEEMLARRLADKMVHSGVLETGIFGSKLAFEVLHQHGHDAVVERWLLREDHPSLLTAGRVNGVLPEELEGLCSRNHAMFTSYAQWLYQALAGITVPNDACGCDGVIVRPFFSRQTDQVEARLTTCRGTIATSWQRTGGMVTFRATIPDGMHAQFASALGVGTFDAVTNTWTFAIAEA